MPIYVFRCPDCGREYEKLVPMDARHFSYACQHCDWPTMTERVPTAAYFRIDKAC